MFNFGTKATKKKEISAIDSQMAITMHANPEMKGARKFTFSELAYETLGFHKNISDLDTPPEIINTVISFGNITNDLGVITQFNLFANNNGVGDLRQVNVGKTTHGFSDGKFYDKIVKLYDLDTTKDHILDITRTEKAKQVEIDNNIEIYGITLRVKEPTEEIAETVETTLEEIELDDNSNVNVTLD